MKRKWWIVGLAALLLACLLALPAGAAGEVAASGSCGNDLTWTLDEEGTLTVSGTGAMTNFSSDSASPWVNNDSIRRIVLQSGVTSVGNSAFYGCSSLTSVTIPKGVKSIGNSAFYGCSALTSVTIPDSVTLIAGQAFGGCIALESITLPFVGRSANSTDNSEQNLFGYIFGRDQAEGTTRVEQYCYDSRGWIPTSTFYCIPSSLRSVTVTGGSIGYGAFSNCSMLTDVTIGNGVTYIGGSAFSRCKGLTSVTIPKSVTSIGGRAFYFCSGLTSVTIPESVTSIDGEAFYGCSRLTSVTIPDSVTTIGSEAFCNCSGLTSVTIGNGVTSIGEKAFNFCSGLTSVTIPDSVTSIGGGAFGNCIALESITLPFVGGSVDPAEDADQYPFGYVFGIYRREGLTEVTQDYYGGESGTTSGTYYIPSSLHSVTITGGRIRYGAFDDCAMLREITLGNGVTGIGDFAFDGCSALTSLTIGNGVTSIGDAAFDGCSESVEVSYTGSLSEWNGISTNPLSGRNIRFLDLTAAQGPCGENAYYTMDPVTGVLTIGGSGAVTSAPWKSARAYVRSVAVGGSIEALPAEAFADCAIRTAGPSGGGYDLEYGWTRTIPVDAFNGANTLERIELPSVVLKLSDRAFKNCSGLKQLRIPDTLEIVGSDVVSGCTMLDSLGETGSGCALEIPWKSLFLNAFLKGNESLKRVELPADVTEIGDGMFSGCSGLTGYAIPAWVTGIGSSAFSDCSGLISVTIPDSVTSIGDYAFRNCPKLTTVEIPASVTEAGSGLFSGCSALTSAVVPGNVSLSGLSSLRQLVIRDGTTSIASSVCKGCRNLVFVYLPADLTEIGESAFYECEHLMDVYFGGSEAQWDAIDIGASNGYLTTSAIHFDSVPPPFDSVPTPQKHGLVQDEDGIWRCYKNGVFQSGVSGLMQNEYGWWYVTDGVLDQTCTGLVTNESGAFYVYKGQFADWVTGYEWINGEYCELYRGQLTTWKTDAAVVNPSGDGKTWTAVRCGKVDPGYTGLAYNANGAWYLKDGVLDQSFTGLVTNEYGTFYIYKGQFANWRTGYEWVNGEYCEFYEGQLTTWKTDAAVANPSGDGETWVAMRYGRVDPTYTGLAYNANGTWYLKDGVLDLSFTGLVTNEYGTFYVYNGQFADWRTGYEWVNGEFCEFYEGQLTTWKTYATVVNPSGDTVTWTAIRCGRVDPAYTGLAQNEYGWWYISSGALDLSFVGLVTNADGTWFIYNGQLADWITEPRIEAIDGGMYYVYRGQIGTWYTGDLAQDGVTYHVSSGVVTGWN